MIDRTITMKSQCFTMLLTLNVSNKKLFHETENNIALKNVRLHLLTLTPVSVPFRATSAQIPRLTRN